VTEAQIQISCEAENRTKPSDIDLELSTDLYAFKLKKDLENVHKTVNEMRAVRTNKSKLNYDRKTRAANFTVGDQVLLRDVTTKVGRNKKLSFKYTGPFKVIGHSNGVNYTIKGNGTKGRRMLVHVNRLKKWYGPIPSETGTIELETSQVVQQQPELETVNNTIRQEEAGEINETVGASHYLETYEAEQLFSEGEEAEPEDSSESDDSEDGNYRPNNPIRTESAIGLRRSSRMRTQAKPK
jgi:hypothetical protein